MTDSWENWNDKINAALKYEDRWRKCAAEAIEAYEGPEHVLGTRFNILWANTDTLEPILYSRTPEPDVRPRVSAVDSGIQKANNMIAAALERALDYSLDSDEYPFDDTIEAAVQDYLLSGRGVSRVHYNYDTDEDDNQVAGQVWCEHVLWDEFTHQPAKRWDRVNWVCFDHYMTREELEEKFGKDVADVVRLQYDSFAPNADQREKYGDTRPSDDTYQTALVREIWDKAEREVLWMSPGLDGKWLQEPEADPLGLDKFFPCPQPLLFLSRPTSLVPIPPYELYKDQADELNMVTSRINGIIEAMRVRGVYPNDMGEIMQIIAGTGHTPDLTPIPNWTAFAEKGGLDGVISWMPLEQLAKALVQLSARRQQLVQEIYELTGIADIIRGTTDPSETARAQTLKSQFATRRLRPKQRRVQRFVRALLRLKSEIICEKFSPAVLAKMTGVPITSEAIGTMTKDELRDWSIDIETDSTVAEEELYEKQELLEVLQAIGGVLQSVGPLVQQGAMPFSVLQQMLLFAIQRFRPGKEVEQAIMAMQQPQPQPDPKVQLEAQDQARLAKQDETNAAIEGARLQIEKGKADVENAVALAGILQ